MNKKWLPKYLPIFKYYLYNILDIIIYYSTILSILFLIYFVIVVLMLLLFPHDYFLCFSYSPVFYFNEQDGSVLLSESEPTQENLNINNTQGGTPDLAEILALKHTSKFKTVYKAVVNKTRRKFYWEMVECEKKRYNSYNDFKKNWDPNTKIRVEIKKEIKSEMRQTLIVKRALSVLINSLRPSNQR